MQPGSIGRGNGDPGRGIFRFGGRPCARVFDRRRKNCVGCVWDVDTAREYQTVNGVAGTGGAIDGLGPVIVGGMLYVNSGYGMFGGAPGNVLLAFSVDGK